jgi:ABC-type transporter Mla MlaB component
MVEYKEIAKVDAQALSAQRSLTEALWLTLQKQGIKDGTSRRVECFFVAREDSAVASLLNGFPETAEWNNQVSQIENPPGAISVKIISPPAYLSREALLELVDVMMIAAHGSGCVFDGFHVDLSDLQQRSWWKFW